MLTTEFSFESLIDPVSQQTFLEKHWEKEYLLVSRSDPEYYGSLFSFADMDRCIHAARDTDREVLSLVPPPDSGRAERKYRGIDISTRHLYHAFHSGETITVNSAQRLWPPLTEVADTLSEALSAVASINIYMTPADSQGFGVHIDTHDVFVIQVDGYKDWYIHEPYYEAPTETGDARHYIRKVSRPRPADGEKLIEKVRIHKGDLLYLPRGFAHKAATSGEPSLHLTVGIHPLYWLDLLKAAVESAALRHPELRRGLPPGFLDDPGVQGGMEETFRSLLDLTRSTIGSSFARALEAMTAHRLAWQSYPPDGHFAQLNQLSQLSRDSLLLRRRALDCQLVNSGNTLGIAFAENEVRGPKSIGKALAYIRDRKRFRISDLPGLDERSQLVLARRLIREGLLRVEQEVAAT